MTEKSSALAPESGPRKSESCDGGRQPDQKSGCRRVRDLSIFEFNELPRKSGACAAVVP